MYAVYVRDNEGISSKQFQTDLAFSCGFSDKIARGMVWLVKFLGHCPIDTGDYDEMIAARDKLINRGYDSEVEFCDIPQNKSDPNTPFARWCDKKITTEEFNKEWAIWGRKPVPENHR